MKKKINLELIIVSAVLLTIGFIKLMEWLI
jgi:hypothetical protein